MRRIIKTVDMKAFTCPQCLRTAMTRTLGHVVSQEKVEHKTRDNSSISLFVDICDKCQGKNYRKYFEPTRTDIRKVLKAMNDTAKETPEESLEDLL